jgi:hypothetical protein
LVATDGADPDKALDEIAFEQVRDGKAADGFRTAARMRDVDDLVRFLDDVTRELLHVQDNHYHADLEAARQAAASIPNVNARITCLSLIAQCFQLSGDPMGCLETLSLIEPDVDKLADDDRQTDMYALFALEQARCGDRESAARNLAIVSSRAKQYGLPPAGVESFALANAALGHVDVALALAPSVKSDPERLRLLDEIVSAQADSGDYSGAEETARGIGNGDVEREAELSIAIAEARARQPLDAERTFATVTASADLSNEASMLTDVAQHWIPSGDLNILAEWIERTADPAKQIAICLGAAQGLLQER